MVNSFKLGKNPPLLKVFGLHDKVGVVYPGKTFTRNAILEFLRKMALHMCVELNSSWSSGIKLIDGVRTLCVYVVNSLTCGAWG